MAEVEIENTSSGKLLSSARKKLGLSEADIAEQLNLSIAVIKELEADQNTTDIPDAFLRGYLRTYARAVGEDEEQIVAHYSQAIGTSIVSNHFVSSNDVQPAKAQVGNHMPWFKVLSVAVFIAIIVLAWIAFSQQNTETHTQDTSLSQPLNSNVETKDNTIQQSADLSTNSLDLDKAETVAVTDDENIIEEQYAETENLSIEPAIEAEATESELAFTFIDNCWVKVTDNNGEVLAVGLKTAGRRFTVSGVAPIAVVLGKPRAISLQFNDQTVDLSIYPAWQTARFSLGDD
ncbi:MAG: DUF4115 domain-containing protein [Gammaproteobacteria bacterium]|nr:DUF4115 domain-containing protein [Gammaproteobacteria bacterium]